MTSRICFHADMLLADADGFIVSCVTEDQRGYEELKDRFLTVEEAVAVARNRNHELGLSDSDVQRIRGSAIRLDMNEDARP